MIRWGEERRNKDPGFFARIICAEATPGYACTTATHHCCCPTRVCMPQPGVDCLRCAASHRPGLLPHALRRLLCHGARGGRRSGARCARVGVYGWRRRRPVRVWVSEHLPAGCVHVSGNTLTLVVRVRAMNQARQPRLGCSHYQQRRRRRRCELARGPGSAPRAHPRVNLLSLENTHGAALRICCWGELTRKRRGGRGSRRWRFSTRGV